MIRMKIFTHRGIYYVRLPGGTRRSLRTRDEEEAEARRDMIEREYLKGRLFQLDQGERVTLKKFKEGYLPYRENMSSKTYNQDRLALQLLADVVGEKTALRAITARRIEEFKSTCLARGCKPVSVNSYLRHIKAALGVAEEWYQGYKRPRIKMCKVGKQLPRALNSGEIKKLLKKAKKKNPEFHRLLVFYLWTGCRRVEALRLQWQDVHLTQKEPYCFLKGKGDKERVVPLLLPVLAVLRPIRKDIGPVFVQSMISISYSPSCRGFFLCLAEDVAEAFL